MGWVGLSPVHCRLNRQPLVKAGFCSITLTTCLGSFMKVCVYGYLVVIDLTREILTAVVPVRSGNDGVLKTHLDQCVLIFSASPFPSKPNPR